MAARLRQGSEGACPISLTVSASRMTTAGLCRYVAAT